MKTTLKQRQPITLRQKALKDGRVSLYLDSYDYSSKDKKHSHKYEFLKMYLLPDTKANRDQNKQILQSAQALLSQRLIERANGQAHIKNNKAENLLLSDYIEHHAQVKEKYGQSDKNASQIRSMCKHLNTYRQGVTLAQVDKNFVSGFITYLLGASGRNATKTHKPLSKNTIKDYFVSLTGVLNQAVKDDLITYNPCNKISKEERKVFYFDPNKRTYLTTEELKRLINTPMYREDIKKAFLFACFSGLRISDINSLKWCEIHQDENGKVWIEKEMKKTKKQIILPVPQKALQFLPKKQGDYVFKLGTTENVNTSLKTWAKNAQVDKKICFHISRHTYATTLLTQGADLYTTSKLLGHSSVRTTQIYAEIVNEKKQQAVNLLDNLDLGITTT